MSLIGRIEQWNDARGYGFVRPLESQAGDAARAFVHVRAIARAGRRPADGDLIRYRTERDAQGRLNAVEVSFVNAEAMRRQAQARGEARAASRRRRTGAGLEAGARRGVLALAVAALAGGWPGGLLAQQVLRHKSSKPAFRVAFWITVALNIAAFAWLLRSGRLAALLQALPG